MNPFNKLLYHYILQNIISSLCLYLTWGFLLLFAFRALLNLGFLLDQGCSTLWALLQDHCPLFYALFVKIVLTRSENRLTTFLLRVQAYWANSLFFYLFRNIIKLISLSPLFLHNLNRIIIINRFNECKPSCIFLPLRLKSQLHLKTPKCQKIVFPSDIPMNELNKKKQRNNKMSNKKYTKSSRYMFFLNNIAIERMKWCFSPKHKSQEKITYLNNT